MDDPLYYLRIPMKRMGECDGCAKTRSAAWCCSEEMEIVLHSSPIEDDEAEFLRVCKGFDVDKNGRIEIHIRQGCSHYDKETRKCKIYETRPKICAEFPGHPSQVLINGERKYCSYSWDYNADDDIEVDWEKLVRTLGVGWDCSKNCIHNLRGQCYYDCQYDSNQCKTIRYSYACRDDFDE